MYARQPGAVAAQEYNTGSAARLPRLPRCHAQPYNAASPTIRPMGDDMTTKPAATPPAAHRLPPLPDPPKLDMQQTRHLSIYGVTAILAKHLDALRPDATTLVGGNGYLCRRRSDFPRCPYPDLLVAFGIDQEKVDVANGYVIEEVGKPPDLVMEVASPSTGRNDYTEKRITYANLAVLEYWRFDYTGGAYHDAPLAGDRLSETGVYRPLEMVTEPDGVIWGYSEMLGLSLCWVEGRLRFWYRAQGQYLPDLPESVALVDAAEARAAAESARADVAETLATRESARADTESARADAAEARARMLEQELRRRDNP